MKSLLKYLLLIIFLSSQFQSASGSPKYLFTPLSFSNERTSGELKQITQRIKEDYQTTNERIYAIYRWISGNISYDLDQLNFPLPYRSDEELIQQALSTRKAICQGYSALFQEMCNECGIEAFIVHGYVKLQDEIQNTPHAWNAARVDGKWQLYDPTWGAGHVADNKFITNYNEIQFNISPTELLKTRMPFDPIWQLLEQPLSHDTFITGSKSLIQPPVQNFNDSINEFLAADSMSRYLSESRRVKAAGLDHPLISDYYNYLVINLNVMLQNREIDYKNTLIDRMNQAIAHFNEAVKKYNEYIAAKNSQFKKPLLSDDLVRQKIDEPDHELLQSELLVNSVTEGGPDIDNMSSELRKSLKELRKAIDEDRAFVDKYLNTAKSQRMFLFRTPVYKSKSRH